MTALRVHYDFASTLCYVAHRLMQRMAADLRRLDLQLVWSPLDLSYLTGWPRDAEVAGPRRANAARVAREVGVEVDVPRLWGDSRWANAAALCIEDGRTEAVEVWRERVFSAWFEERRDLSGADGVLALAGEAGVPLERDALEEAHGTLLERTQLAAAEEVTGVPTFMLDGWPFGGIQTEDTMRRILERWVARRGRTERPG